MSKLSPKTYNLTGESMEPKKKRPGQGAPTPSGPDHNASNEVRAMAVDSQYNDSAQKGKTWQSIGELARRLAEKGRGDG